MSIDPVSIAIEVALTAASMALTASQTIEGPRVSDLSVSVADYGTPVPDFLGTSRIELPCFYAEPIKEVKKRRKTKGGKYNEYTYFGTWASLVCEKEITTYRKVFFDKNLIYDGDSGQNVFSALTGYEYVSNMTFFYGTETQSAPERMIAYVEDQEGPGLCPDYLGVAYIWFEDVPLEKIGNRLPQVSAIVSTNFSAPSIQGTVEVKFWANANASEFVKDTKYAGIAFLDSLGNQIGSTVWSAAKNNTGGWQQGSVSAVAPVGADVVRIYQKIHKGYGTHPHYGYIDDITATLDGADIPLTNPGAEDGLSGWTDTTAYSLYAHDSSTGDGVVPRTGALMFGGFNTTFSSGEVIAYQDISGLDLITIGPDNYATTLQEVCEYVSGLAGLSAEDYDFSAFDQTIYGYSWAQGPAKNIVAPLLDVFDCDVRPSGFLIEGVKRGSHLSGSDISYERMVRQQGEDGSTGSALYTVTTKSESDIPRRVFFVFADLNADHQPNTAVFQRNEVSVATLREMTIDMSTLAFTASAAQPVVERYLRRVWTGSVIVKANLEPAEMLLDPADVRNLLLEEDIAFRGRLVRSSRKANRITDTTWEQDSAAVNVAFSSPGAEQIGRPPSEIFILSGTQGFILDVPLLSDADDSRTPFLYVGAGPTDAAAIWPGADVWRSDSGQDGTYSAGWDGVGASQAAVWGDVSGTLPDALSSVVDEASQLVVLLQYGELESIDQTTFDTSATANLALVGSNEAGWELIQFRDAVLQSVNVSGVGEYIITGLRRGMRGTEAQTAEHQSGETFLLVSNLHKHDMGASEIGSAEYFETTTLGSVDEEAAQALTLDFAAAAQRPLSPVHAELVRDDVTGDWTIGFVRRTRIGGNLIDGRDVPLGETAELYRIKILDGSLGATRTIETTSQTGNIYSNAEQTTDWGMPVTSLSVEIVQVAPDLDLEGYPLAAAA